jgi:hypothetical protein
MGAIVTVICIKFHLPTRYGGTCNFSSQEAEIEGSQVLSLSGLCREFQSGLYSKTLSQKKKNPTKNNNKNNPETDDNSNNSKTK